MISLERRLRKIEAARFQTDPAVRALSDAELAAALCKASDDPSDHALADWFEAGCQGAMPVDALESVQRSLLAMTIASIESRLRKVERREGLHGDIAQMSDAALWRLVRSGYRDLERKHGSLAQAARHLRGTGDTDDAALATLIEEDIGASDVSQH